MQLKTVRLHLLFTNKPLKPVTGFVRITGLWKRFYYARTSRANKDALSGGQLTAIVIRSAPRVLDGFVAQFGILFMTSISWNVYDQVI